MKTWAIFIMYLDLSNLTFKYWCQEIGSKFYEGIPYYCRLAISPFLVQGHVLLLSDECSDSLVYRTNWPDSISLHLSALPLKDDLVKGRP